MAINNIILAQPEANTSIDYIIPTGETASFQFGSEDISGLRLGDNGELIISFVDGGQLSITNFEDYIQNGNTLELSDGTVVDPSLLMSGLDQDYFLNQVSAAAGTDGIEVIGQPGANTSQEISLVPGQKYACEFNPANAAEVEIKDGQMILTFADGSQVVINNYSEVMAGDLPAELTLADGTVIEESDLLTKVTEVETVEEILEVAEEGETEGEGEQVASIEPAAGEEADIAQQLAQIEPAAGEEAGATNTGFGFGSTPTAAPLNAGDAVGPIGPTALRYGIPSFEIERFSETPSGVSPVDDRPIIQTSSAQVDETDFVGGTGTVSGSVSVNYGADGPGDILPNATVTITCNSVAGGALRSGGADITITQIVNGYIGTVDGTAPVVTAFEFTIDPVTGDYTYTQYVPFDHSDTTNNNEDICIDFGFVAIDSDGDRTASSVTISVLDDGPSVDRQAVAQVDETNMVAGQVSTTGTFIADGGEDGIDSYALADPSTFSAGGSLAGGTLTSDGNPIAVTLSGNTYTGTANGITVFTLELNPTTGSYEFILYGPLDHADGSNPNDVINLNFDVVVTDGDGDTATGTVIVNVLDDAPEVLSQTPAQVDETDITAGQVSTTGQFVADFGEDGVGGYGATDASSFSATGSVAGGTLTSCGSPVTVSLAGNTYTGVANGVTIFTLEINSTNGQYTYTQFGPLDHADGSNPNDVLTLNFGAVATDGDGDTATGIISVNVLDDAPEATPVYSTVDETDLPGGVNVTGNIGTADYGNDGAGSIGADGSFTSSGSQLSGTLTSGGNPVVVTFSGGTYTGVANGVTIFTMTINSDGSYVFDLLGTLDHADPNDPNDIINLDFGYVITDCDDDTATSFVRVRVKDDVPVIGDSRGNVDETNFDAGPLVYTDSVDHDFGLEPGTISLNTAVTPTGLTSNSNPVIVTGSGNTYTGVANGVTIFTLTIDPSTGQYTYTQFVELDHADSSDPNDILSLDFGITITSTTDGSIDNGVITIDVADDGPVAVDDINGAEEGQLITGDVTANDELSEDNPNIVTNVRFDGTDYTVPAGGFVIIPTTLGTFTMKSDGTYTYVSNNNDPSGVDKFTYTLVDNDGDSDTADLSITVTPDGQPVAVSELLAVDETNLTPGPMIFNGDVNADFGLDGAGTVTANNGFTAGGSLLGGNLTSSGNPVIVTLAGNTYTGVANGVTIFTLQINVDGSYSFQLFDHIDHADGSNPNDIITLEFGVTLADADGDTADGTITIQIYDDAPVAYDDAAVAVQESQTVTGNVTTNDEMGEDNPNDVVAVIFNGATYTVPATGTVFVPGQFGTLTIASNGSYSYTANSNNPNGTDTFTYVLEDFDGDQDTAEFSFNVTEIDDRPVVTPVVEVVDETNLGPIVETGTVTVNYGSDGPGEVNPNGGFTASGSVAGGNLTSCGSPVIVTLTGNTYTGVANGVTIFTMEVLENGSYTFTQYGAIDHADGTNPNDIINLSFGITATDSDGDSTPSTITVRVRDDAPEITDIANVVDEDSLATGPIVLTDTVPHDFGNDGAGSIDPTGIFIAKFQMGGPAVTLQSQGQNITVTQTANGYVGVAGGRTIFTLDINPTTGEYTYTQFDQIDHPDGTNPDDVIWLKFQVEITDCDGDTDKSFIIIDVHDSGPDARNDSRSTDEGQTITGNVTNNDESGADEAATVISVNFNGTVYTVPAMGNLTVPGAFGTLTINAQGVYSYTANNNNPDGTDVFTYILQDFDGDTDPANLSIRVAPDFEPTDISGSGETDDTIVGNSGSDIETGTINVNYNGDGPGTTTGNGSFSAANNMTGGTLSYNGIPVNVTFNAGNNTYTGSAGGTTVFTMTINANGTYRFVQREPLDHANTNADNEAITLRFGVTATDSDGDTGNGTVTIRVRDDGPDAKNDTDYLDKTETTETGNILSNDDAGADGGKLVTQIIFGSTVYTLPANGNNITIPTDDGTLRINNTGAYTYTRADNSSIDDVFTYTMRDGDGDTDTAKLTITGPADNAPTVGATDTVDETNLTGGTQTETGSFVNYNGDGAGSAAGTGSFSASDATLTAGGVPVTVSFSGGVYTGKAGGKIIFTMKINANGTYEFKLFDNLDHPNGGAAHNDNIQLRFGVSATDGDGDTGTGTVRINVRDDGPDARNDSDHLTRFETIETGNILSNDSAGTDGGRTLVNIRFGSTTYTLPANGNNITIPTDDGTLRINNTGAYTYIRADNSSINDVFTYTIRDFDGDTDTATLTITGAVVPTGDGGDGDGGGDGFGDGGDGGGGGDGFGDGTPLALDLDGDGIELISRDEGVLFDIDLDGIEDQTAWVGADDGLLALDKNGDGVINDRSELFGDTDGFTDGFDNLSSYDENGDGVIDENDSVYDDLLVWQDSNSDGNSDPSEMMSLSDLGIVSIFLEATMPEDYYVAGNWISHVSSYQTSGGEQYEIVDAWFQYESGAYGTDGAQDTFLFQAIAESAATITDFNAQEGDVLDLSLLIEGSDDITEAINDYVYATEVGGDTIISVDVDGADGPAEAVEVARLDGVTGITVDQLLADGNIVTD